MNALLITTSVRGSSKTQVWTGERPLPLGHPMRFVLERSATGLRLRDLASPLDMIESGRAREIPHEKLASGAELEMGDFKFTIRAAREAAPAFEGPARGAALRTYHCAGKWILDSRTLDGVFVARFRGRAIFEIRREVRPAGDHFRLLARSPGVKLSGREGPRPLNAGEPVELAAAELIGSTLSFVAENAASIQSWKFGLADAPSFVDRAAPRGAVDVEADEVFRKAIRYATIGLVAFALMSWFWPKPKEDSKELIPAQFTKIVLSQPQKSSSAQSVETGAPSKVPAKVRNAAVVQAFRAQALRNAVSGLLRGGMTRLLAQSDFVAGTAQSMEARRIFDGKPAALRATSPLTGLAGSRDVKVASLGGAEGAGGAAVGYGKGERAGVKGQGKGFVPFVAADENGSVVDEGLTKDEVGEVIHRHLSEVRYCYESAMVRAPDIEGKLVTNFTIGASGAVKSADVKSSTLPDPRLDDCILRRLVTWRFPKPRGAVDVAVSYPFIFKTLGR